MDSGCLKPFLVQAIRLPFYSPPPYSTRKCKSILEGNKSKVLCPLFLFHSLPSACHQDFSSGGRPIGPLWICAHNIYTPYTI